MFEFLEKLRHKSDSTKKQLAFFSAFLFAGLIFLVWLSVLYPNWKSTQNNKEEVVAEENSPIKTFGAMFSSSLGAIGEQFSEMKKTISGFASSSSYVIATSSASATTTTVESGL